MSRFTVFMVAMLLPLCAHLLAHQLTEYPMFFGGQNMIVIGVRLVKQRQRTAYEGIARNGASMVWIGTFHDQHDQSAEFAMLVTRMAHVATSMLLTRARLIRTLLVRPLMIKTGLFAQHMLMRSSELGARNHAIMIGVKPIEHLAGVGCHARGTVGLVKFAIVVEIEFVEQLPSPCLRLIARFRH